MKTLIVTPTYNEKKNIKSFIKTVFKYNPEAHLLIIDDNSPDKTSLEVRIFKRYSLIFF